MQSYPHDTTASDNRFIEALKHGRLVTLRHCGKHPVLAAVSFAAIAAAMSMTAAISIIHLQVREDVGRTHMDAVRVETAIWADVVNTFNQLKKVPISECGQKEAAELQRLLEQSRYVRNLYVEVTPTNQCGTSIKDGFASETSQVVTSIDIGASRYEVVQGLTPLTPQSTWTLNRIHQGKYTIEVIKNIIPSRNFTKQATLYDAQTPLPISINGEMIKNYTLGSRLELMAKSKSIQSGYSWGTSSYIWVSPLPMNGITVVTGMTVHDAISKYENAVLSAVLIVLTLAGLTYIWSRRWLEKYESIEHYVRLLIRSNNLVCLYQPIVDLKTGSPVGCEVLVRFKVSQTTVLPSEALGFMFEQGLSWRLDQAVIRRAWRELNDHIYKAATPIKLLHPLKIAINLFPNNIRYNLLTPLFNELKKKTPGYDRFWRVNLEIVEKQYTHNLVEQIARLRKDGFLFSVDDFGTGFSNIHRIRTVKPDFLKIDGAFISDLSLTDRGSSFVPEIIGIADAIEAMTVAEGVETKEQHMCLQELGVKFGQGYLYAKPMAITAFVEYLRRHPQSPDAQQTFVKTSPAEVKASQPNKGAALPPVLLNDIVSNKPNEETHQQAPPVLFAPVPRPAPLPVRTTRAPVKASPQPAAAGWGMVRRGGSIKDNVAFNHSVIVDDSAFDASIDEIDEPLGQESSNKGDEGNKPT